MNDRLEIAARILAGMVSRSIAEITATIPEMADDACRYAEALILRERETRPKAVEPETAKSLCAHRILEDISGLCEPARWQCANCGAQVKP